MVLLLDAASQRSLTPRASSHDDKINSSYSILSEVSTAETPIATREPPHNDGGDGGCGQGGGRAVKIDQQNKGRRARDGLSDNALVEEDEYYQGLKTYESAALDALLAASTSAQQQAAAVAPCPDAT